MRSRAAHAVFKLMQLVHWFHVVKLSHATTTTGYCTIGKCIASLLAFMNLFIACDVKEALKWEGALPPLFEKCGRGMSPPAPPSPMPLSQVLLISTEGSAFQYSRSVVSETGGQEWLMPPTFQREGAEPPHFRAFLMSHAMNRFINASKEAMHLPVVQKPVAVVACESFTTRNWFTSCVSILCCRTYMTGFGHKNHEY